MTTFAWDWATGIPEMLSDGSAVYLVGHDTLGWEDAGGHVLSEVEGWTYAVPDALGSVRQAVDAAGAVVAAREWTPYGVESGGAQAGLGYTGEWFDASVGLQYLRARWYDPDTSNFQSEDPWPGDVEWPVTLHPYVYVVRNPIRYVDPAGLLPVSPGFIEIGVEATGTKPWSLGYYPGIGMRYGPDMWLLKASELPIVKTVFDRTDADLAAGRYTNSTIGVLYSDVWLQAFSELGDAGYCGGDKLLESAHISLVVLAGIGRWQRSLEGAPGYIPNLAASDPRGQQGPDTTWHFFLHSFLSFETLYSHRYRLKTGAQLTAGIRATEALFRRRVDMIEDQYVMHVEEDGFENNEYASRVDRRAYETAITAGHIYEVISTYVSSQQGDTLLKAIFDDPENFREWLEHPDPSFPSGVRDPGVFSRDLRANRLGAAFGVAAFHKPVGSPASHPPYYPPLPR